MLPARLFCGRNHRGRLGFHGNDFAVVDADEFMDAVADDIVARALLR
jgi:hypothetical protein